MKSKPKYKRTTLFENNDVEVILIDWEPGSETPIHDHGKSYGLVNILHGKLTEDTFSFPDLKISHSKSYGPNTIVLELPGTIHRMKNVGKKSARSLHIYIPPLVMREYKQKKKGDQK